jgi:ABC-type Fe3+-hydroxamate transport system substrate-binding protein
MKDQTAREVNFPKIPSRIISVVPSQTELLFDLGLNEEIVGITKFCVHPEELVKSKIKIGGTKNLNLEKIRSLKPDLILANKEENKRSEIEELMKDFPVWISDVKTLEDALNMIESVGEITGKQSEAKSISATISDGFNNLLRLTSNVKRISAVYLIWNKPMMTVGNDTFISHMMERCGFKNVFGDRKRYPEITEGELSEASPQIILLSSEPFPFRQKHIEYFQNICPKAEILLADGQMFSWYGSRLQHAPAYFAELIRSSAA